MSDMATLFARDPLKHTKEDIGLIVKKLREERSLFEQGKKIAPAKPKLTAKQEKVSKLGIELDLSDM